MAEIYNVLNKVVLLNFRRKTLSSLFLLLLLFSLNSYIIIRKIPNETAQTAQTAEKSMNDNSDVKKVYESENPFSYTPPKQMPLFSEYTQNDDEDDKGDKLEN